MNIEKYRKHMTAEMLMGPNSLRILEELLIKHPFTSSANASVLDLGCGKGLTSLAIANETGAKVYANDLWISAEDNAKRFSEWGGANKSSPYTRMQMSCILTKGSLAHCLASMPITILQQKKAFLKKKYCLF